MMQTQSKSDLLRRVFIGLCLGLFLSFTISLFISDTPKQSSFDTIDQETIAIAEPTPTTPTPEANDEPALEIDDSKAKRYRFFAGNKRDLTQTQIRAINNKTPIISIIITPLGQQRGLVNKVIETLPNDITIGLSSHASPTEQSAQNLSDNGFELWLALSTITLDMNHDKGALALTPTRNFEYNINLLTEQIGGQDFYAGLVLPPQSLIKKSGKMWEDIVYDIFGQGFGLLDNNKDIVKPSLYFFDDFRVPYLQSDVAIGDTMSLDAFQTLLDTAQKNTVDEGRYILSFSSLTPAHLDILARWVDSLPQENITLVPLSAQAQL